MSEAMRRFTSDMRRDLSRDRAAQFFTIVVGLMAVAAVVFAMLGSDYAREMLAFMAGGIPAGLLVALLSYYPRYSKLAIAAALAAMPLWMILGFASLWPGLEWLAWRSAACPLRAPPLLLRRSREPSCSP